MGAMLRIEINVPFLLSHLAVAHDVKHIPLSQKPIEESAEHLFHSNFLLVLRLNQVRKVVYSEHLPISFTVVRHRQRVVATHSPAQSLHKSTVRLAQKTLHHFLSNIRTNVLLIVRLHWRILLPAAARAIFHFLLSLRFRLLGRVDGGGKIRELKT